MLELHGTTHEVVCMQCGGTTPRVDLQSDLTALNPSFATLAEVARDLNPSFATLAEVARASPTPPGTAVGSALRRAAPVPQPSSSGE